jgi:hypothetical protein
MLSSSLLTSPRVIGHHRPLMLAVLSLLVCSGGRGETVPASDDPAKYGKYSAAHASDLPSQTIPLFWVKYDPQKH